MIFVTKIVRQYKLEKEAQRFMQGIVNDENAEDVFDQQLEDRIMQSVVRLPASPPHEVKPLSYRRWVVSGVVVLLSLCVMFMGFNFNTLADGEGTLFILPMGILAGVVITGYGALFIGSHLKELSKRFGIR